MAGSSKSIVFEIVYMSCKAGKCEVNVIVHLSRKLVWLKSVRVTPYFIPSASKV